MWIAPALRNLSIMFSLSLCLFGAPGALAQRVDQLTDFKSDDTGSAAMDDAGTVVYAVSRADPLGTNPRHVNQIFRWPLPSGAVEQLTAYEEGARSVSVSDDGQWLAYISSANPLGTNDDGSFELFVVGSDGSGLSQLTNNPGPEDVFRPTIAGSDNRIVFDGRIDPLGTNPTGAQQVFVIDRDGTGLTQLAPGGAPTISDDGERIAFVSNEDLTGGNPDGAIEAFGIHADGSGLRQLSSVTGSADHPKIAGGGSVVAFVDWQDAPGPPPIYVVNWDGSGLFQAAAGELNSIRDDGKFVFFTAEDDVEENSEVFSAFTGAIVAPIQVTDTGDDVSHLDPVVSGNGNRIAFVRTDPWRPGQLMVADAAGGSEQTLTANADEVRRYFPELTSDGTRIVFLSNFLSPSGGSHVELWRIQADGSDEALVMADTGVNEFAVSGDGQTIVFDSIFDLTGDNTCSMPQIFGVRADGTGLAQLTPAGNCDFNHNPVISASGGTVVFEQAGSGENKLFRTDADGSNLQLVVSDGNNLIKFPRVSDSGEWVAYVSGADIGGGNPDGGWEVFRVRSDGTGLQQLTMDPVHTSTLPDISGDGDRIVYSSSADPLGTNPENNQEIFLYEVSTSTRTQLTVTTQGSSGSQRISRNGAWVFFSSGAPIFGEPSSGGYRVSVATGEIERVTGLGSGVPRPDATGDRAVFESADDATGLNPDLSDEIWLVDQNAPAIIRVSRETPTLVTWDAEPKPKRYDVIRGDLANLAAGPGGTVNLGTVVCIEDDATDLNTAGHEDAVGPEPGQVLFYLYRGSQGVGDGPGSYGSYSGERTAGAGDCS